MRFERRLPDSGEKISKFRVPRETGSNYQCIDEQSDKGLAFQKPAPCNRHTNTDVLLAAVSVEQNVESRQQNTKERGPLPLGQSFKSLYQGSRGGNRDDSTQKGLFGRSHAVSRQLETCL